MKKNLVLMLLIAGVLVGLSMMVSAFHCTDTDGGKNYHEKGTGSTSSGPYDTSSATDGCKEKHYKNIFASFLNPLHLQEVR